MIRRRAFISLLGGAAAWPLAARAQQGGPMRRIGVLVSNEENDPQVQRQLAAFQRGLAELGWIEGRNVQIDRRFTDGDPVRVQAFTAELVGLKPDVILASGPTTVSAVQRETRAIPIVFAQINDPLGGGVVASLAHPGGNITGFTPTEFSVGGKWLGLLKEIAPGVVQAGAVLDAGLSDQIGMWRAMEAAAPSLRMLVAQLAVAGPAEIESAITGFAGESNAGLIVLANRTTIVHRERIIALAATHRLPAVYAYDYFVADGGLASYGPNLVDLYRRTASYVDRILKGEKPGDLPVQQPTKYELAINLKTAKALGLDVPPTLLAVADEVIE
jgi:putative ABC transport system substrate-binding protein